MRTWSPGQLLLVAVFLLLPLVNFLLTLWRRRRRESTRAGFEPVAPETPTQETPPRAIQAARAGVSGDRPRRETPRVPAEVLPAPRASRSSARLGPRDARRGVVLMAILGPCRALEPQLPPVPEARGPAAPSPLPVADSWRGRPLLGHPGIDGSKPVRGPVVQAILHGAEALGRD